MKKVVTVLKTSIILFLITSISALLLAFVNAKTAPLIAQNASKKQAEALKTVMPDAADFIEFDADDEMKAKAEEYGCEINNVYEAVSASGEEVGICSVITGSGYESGLCIAVGVDSNLKVVDIQIIASSETPGLGQNASKDEFKGQYKGKGGSLSVVKSGAGENEINAISGATMTSDGVTDIVNTAVEIARLKGGNVSE